MDIDTAVSFLLKQAEADIKEAKDTWADDGDTLSSGVGVAELQEAVSVVKTEVYN